MTHPAIRIAAAAIWVVTIFVILVMTPEEVLVTFALRSSAAALMVVLAVIAGEGLGGAWSAFLSRGRR